MKKHILLVGLVLTLAFIAGCGDDDECPTCPNPSSIVAFGTASLGDGEFDMWLYFIGSNGLPAVDSVTVDGELCDTTLAFEAGSPLLIAYYEDTATELSSGDTVTVIVYTPAGISTCNVRLLDYEEDNPQIITYSQEYPYDTVAIGTDVEITWHQVEGADWYLVYYDYSCDSVGTHIYREGRSFGVDTSFTIDGSIVEYNGYMYIDVDAITGPLPTATSGNFVGSAVSGSISSYSYEGLTVYVGTGNAYPGPYAASSSQTEERPSVLELLRSLQIK